MDKQILEEAVKDAKLLREAAIENAKNVLVEAISPQIEQKVSEQLGEDLALEMPATGMYEVEDEEMDFPKEEDEMEEVFEAKKEDDEEEEVCEAKKEDEEELEETVSVTQEDLRAALAEVLNADLCEAEVTKGFGDVEDATPQTAGGKGQKGIADEKSGETHWKDEEPPASEDWTVKESSYKKAIKALQEENNEYKKACNYLRKNLQEVNLFNSKLLHTNKLLQMAELSNKQRVSVIESVDRAQNLREVELVYKSLSESFKIAGVLKESKVKKTSKGAKASRYTPASSTMLKEGIEREENVEAARWTKLAGLTK
jgi:hypothetical protein